MKKKSLVKYVGGQDKIGKSIFKLKTSELYTVKKLCVDKLKNKKVDCVVLEECPNIVFKMSMFVEVQSPINLDSLINSCSKINLETIKSETKYSILEYLN